jgi:hypothetical protein
MEHLKTFKWVSGQPSPNPNGRPKKMLSLLKNIGYTKTQVEDTILTMLTMKRKELEQIDKDDQFTILERIIAGTLVKSHDKNSLFNLELLLTRSQGKPKETIDQTITSKDYTITLNLNNSVDIDTNLTTNHSLQSIKTPKEAR